MTHPDNIPEYHELVDALMGMAEQYLSEGPRGLIYEDSSISSDAMCVDALTRLGLLKDRQIIDDAFEPGYLEKRFSQKSRPPLQITISDAGSGGGGADSTSPAAVKFYGTPDFIKRNADLLGSDQKWDSKIIEPPTPPHHKKPDKPTT